MRIPRWLVDKRHDICVKCDMLRACTGKFSILDEAPRCPKKLLIPADAEIANRAWPSNAPKASGCCDSARNYVKTRG